MKTKIVISLLIIMTLLISGCSDKMYEKPEEIINCTNQEDCVLCCVNISNDVPFSKWSSESRFNNCLEVCGSNLNRGGPE